MTLEEFLDEPQKAPVEKTISSKVSFGMPILGPGDEEYLDGVLPGGIVKVMRLGMVSYQRLTDDGRLVDLSD